ncbi:hypothetical protein D1631_02955 [Chryseobacterium nematophagum]|uniref:Uncharacterized protein n=2 Tax=Chryseobacterium TaxID=59732 RepID=A0A3M7LFL7_9FLAO|nr:MULTISPECIES: hypothetical protein [Chryseobacterium]RMZ60850.1 hypothetical protein D1632_02430 [Chryseobacterium nematophagum]RNA60965.1 hypothetical protein D1631_02955 [Chryseobacterium nematophagum]CAA7195098.1 hypothetical protein CHRY9293_01341 [Chryseobacterium potabilaquae]
MKGILKIYHPDETLKYNIRNTYCKAVYSNQQHFLEVEIITDDSLDHVDDDSLQYNFPQLSLEVFDFPIDSSEIEGKTIKISDSDEDTYTEVDLFDDDEAYIYDNELVFEKSEDGELQVIWKGTIDDFYTKSDSPIPFRLKCEFRQDDIEVDED